MRKRRKNYELRIFIIVSVGVAIFLSLRPGNDARPPEPSESEAAAIERRSATDPAGTSESSSREIAHASSSTREDESRRRSNAERARFDSTFNAEDTQRGERARADRRESIQEFISPISLDPLELSPNALTLDLSGYDPGGPRNLVAWRIIDGRWSIVATGHSDTSGMIHFPEVVAPRDGIEIVITDDATKPEDQGASNPRSLPSRLPQAPRGVLVAVDESEYFVRIVASEASGQILIAEPNGEVFGRYPIPTLPGASNRVFDIALRLKEPSDFVLIAHEFADGRVSDWNEISLKDAGMGASALAAPPGVN